MKKYRNNVPVWGPYLSESKITKIAMKVGELIRRFDALSHFKEMVVQWCAYYRALREAYDEFQRRRTEHEANVRNDARLRDKHAGPPKPGWRIGFAGIDVA